MWSDLGIEFIFAQMRGHDVNEGYLVTGMLIPLVMPIDVPLWMVAVSTAFAVVIGKGSVWRNRHEYSEPGTYGQSIPVFCVSVADVGRSGMDCRA